MNTNVPENQSTRHTPGPWRKRDHGFIYAPDGEHFETLVARVGAFHDEELLPFSRERWTADAHLIAAAPELLAALDRFLGDECECHLPDVVTPCAYCQGWAAIAKAEGRA